MLAQVKAALDVRYRQVNEYELTAVPAFAAATDRFKDSFRGKTVCCVVSGGNVDPQVYLDILSGAPS